MPNCLNHYSAIYLCCIRSLSIFRMPYYNLVLIVRSFTKLHILYNFVINTSIYYLDYIYIHVYCIFKVCIPDITFFEMVFFPSLLLQLLSAFVFIDCSVRTSFSTSTFFCSKIKVSWICNAKIKNQVHLNRPFRSKYICFWDENN